MSWIFLTNNNDEKEAMDTYVNLNHSTDQPQGVHKIKTTLFSIISLPKLSELQSLAKNPQTMTMNLLSIELQPLF